MSSNSLTLAPAPRSEAAEQVRAEVREFLAAELAAGSFDTHVDTWLSGVDPAFSKKLGERGWLGHDLAEAVRRARADGDGALRRHRGAARRRRPGGRALDRRPAVRPEPAHATAPRSSGRRSCRGSPRGSASSSSG